MAFEFRNLNRIGKSVSISIPKDDAGFLGRECPVEECLGYFKIKPGTGLTGPDLPCHCPYCGHKDSPQCFWTKEQIEYARSVAMREISDAIHKDMKQLEFNHPARGPFGLGISLKVTRDGPVPVRYYREKELETHVTCANCTLEYAIFGVFAFCPDCGIRNSEQMLRKNLDLVARQVELLQRIDDAELRRHILEDALENCISALDGFGREACRVRAAKSNAPQKCENVSFQNLLKAAQRVRELFGIDLQSATSARAWATAHRGFMKRHVLAHSAGVVDQRYIDESGDTSAIVGRKVALDPNEVGCVAAATMEIGAALLRLLPTP